MALELILKSLNYRQALLKQFSSVLLRNNVPCNGYFDYCYGARGLRPRTSWTKVVGEKTEKEKDERKIDAKIEAQGTRFGKAKQRNRNLAYLKVEFHGDGNNVQVPLMKNIFSVSESMGDVESETQPEYMNDSKLTREKIAIVADTSESFPSNHRKIKTEMSKGGMYLAFDPSQNTNKKNFEKIEKGQSSSRDEWMHTVFLNLIQNPSLANDWTQLGESFSDRKFLSTRWPSILLNYLAHKEDHVSGLFEIGMSLADFVKTSGDKHVVLRLVASVSFCVHQGGDAYHDQAFKLYDELCSVTDVLDSSSALLLIRAFAKTSRWRKCLDFLEMTKISGTPSPGHYAPLIKAALKAGEANMVDELFLEMFTVGVAPSEEVFTSLIQQDMVLKLLDLLQKFGWIPSESLAMQIQDYFSRLSPTEEWTGQVTKIDRKSQCRACSSGVNRLPRISNFDFDRLRTVFMTNAVLKKGNVFLNTSPEEVNAFHDFLSRHTTFDVIIDGLNVAHQTRQKAFTNEKDYVLSQVIQYFTGKDKKVLVFGRKHMKNWKSSSLHSELSAGQLEWFYADNISADDPFMLYAALHSGQNASVVTKDELRDHRFLLGAELADLLKMWQRGHQVIFLGLRKQFGKEFPMFKWPDNHDTRVQVNSTGDSWHIPFDDRSERTSFQLPDTWLCLRRT